MAEYIDREYAKKMLEEYRISRTMSMYGDMAQLIEWREGVKCSMKKLDEVPTADVVPKIEVERWRRNLEAVLEERSEEKSEVAREIFEEINEDCFDQFGYFEYEAYAKLKEKYTE